MLQTAHKRNYLSVTLESIVENAQCCIRACDNSLLKVFVCLHVLIERKSQKLFPHPRLHLSLKLSTTPESPSPAETMPATRWRGNGVCLPGRHCPKTASSSVSPLTSMKQCTTLLFLCIVGTLCSNSSLSLKGRVHPG